MDLFSLTWSEFETSVRATFSDLFADKHFSDVTLVCDDERQIKAHKILLSLSSTFFKNTLLKNDHPNPVVYLIGMNYNTLVSIMKFIYLGETQVSQESFPLFMEAAQKLKINGLTEIVALGNITDFTLLEKAKNESKVTREESRNIGDNTSMPEFSQNTSFDKLESVYEAEHYVPSPVRFKTPRRQTFNKTCSCDKCDLSFPDQTILLKHKKTVHERDMHTCKHCDYKTSQQTHLKHHIKNYHSCT